MTSSVVDVCWLFKHVFQLHYWVKSHFLAFLSMFSFNSPSHLSHSLFFPLLSHLSPSYFIVSHLFSSSFFPPLFLIFHIRSPLLSDGLVIHSSSQALIHFNIIILPECSSLSFFLFHPYFISENSSTSSDLLIIPPAPSSSHVHSVPSHRKHHGER